jgi:periplasmic divalent cation tolerance protein
MNGENRYCMVLTTCPNREEGDRIACLLVEGGLAACVQMVDITSCYRWKGKVNRDSEKLLIIKARTLSYGQIEACILQNHSYEVPEVVMVPIEKGSPGYLGWIDQMTLQDVDK